MQITKLILNNFSSYEGENVFDLTVADGKPIILIGGQNGAGKTSLFTAIKIALYGPTAFRYTGANSFYIKKIKEFINTRAFQNHDFNSGVGIEITIKQEREIKKYSITRNWKTDNTKLVESYTILENDRMLDEQEVILFESYMRTIIPPDLFDFFLFDGEEIGNVFSADNYNKYVKDSVLTMCGIDDFAILQNFCRNYLSRNENSDLDSLQYEYYDLQNQIEEKDKQKNNLEIKFHQAGEAITEIRTEIEEKEEIFRRAGGLSDKEIATLQTEVSSLEKERDILSHDIKDFFENIMPFFLLKGFIQDIEKQIRYEGKQHIYDYINYNITKDFICRNLENIDDREVISEKLFQAIMKKIEPGERIFDSYVFYLSQEDEARIEDLMSSVKKLKSNDIIQKIKLKSKHTDRITEINQILRESLSDEDAEEFKKAINDLNERLNDLYVDQFELQNEIAEVEETIKELSTKAESTRQMIMSATKDANIYKITENISKMMKKLIEVRTVDIRRQLAVKTVKNLHSIYRKQNLVSNIYVTEDFRFVLYQEQTYSVEDLKSLLANVGTEEFYKIIGTKSIAILCEYFDLKSSDNLDTAINFCSDNDKTFDLQKKIKLSMLSKGERQIFVLALYWAIIQVSGKKIPFIIDTPYARIDANHRGEISAKFFPNISEQVIILSTDEEITQEYHKIIKPYISREYLLSNNLNENKTTVSDGYFFSE